MFAAQQIGRSLTAPGDVDGDGSEDLAVFERSAGDSLWPEGGYLALGPLLDPSTSDRQGWTLDETTAIGLGLSLRGTPCGDVSGDGQDDLCTDAGVWFGPVAETRPPDVDFAREGVRQEGHPLVAADLDADGDVELVLWEPGDGALHRLELFEPGVAPVADRASTSTALPGCTALAAGDLDGDGVEDLVAAWHDGEEGHVTVFSDPAIELTVAAEALAIGDLDADGQPDLVAGVPGSGEIHVFYGPLSGSPTPSHVWQGEQHPDDRFGAALDIGDVDGDGVDDLLVGAPAHAALHQAEGRAYLAYGPLQ